MRKRDLSFVVSAGLLVVATVVATTGLVSDLWDLNEFVPHKYAGYTLALLALAHVYLRGGRLLAYARGRLGKRPRTADGRRQQTAAVGGPWSAVAMHAPLSRRGFVGLLVGGVGGFLAGRWTRPGPSLPYGADVGVAYHQWSKPSLRSLLGTVANWGRQPALYKEYAWAEQIPLPPPGDFRGLYTEEAIQRRRSVRDYSGEPVTLEELSRLLHYTDGITAERWGLKLRAAPSAGALYPIEIYPVIHRVEGLEPGLYHYAVRDHALEKLRAGDLRGEIVRHGLVQEFLGQANLVLVFTAIFQRLRWKYQERTYRYALLEAGHLGQNVYLAATSMGMGACAVGAFLDDPLNELLGVDGEHEAAIYMLAVGKV
ncbi:MAG: SagB/ThcOx family dehydrogenase [Anaerolineae bacterium]